MSVRWTIVAVAVGAGVGVLAGGVLVVLAYAICVGDSMCTASDRSAYVRMALLLPLFGVVLAVGVAAVVERLRRPTA